jgi:WD40 repeat protein
MPRKSRKDNIPPGFSLRHTLQGHSIWIGRIAWSPDGRFLASPSSDQTIRLWDAQTGQHLRTLEGHTDPVNSVVWSPDGKALASGSADKTIRLWDAQAGRSLQTLEGNSEILLIFWHFWPILCFISTSAYDSSQAVLIRRCFSSSY